MDIKIYEPELGLDGTIPQLVDQANRYTADYSDAALERISELAKLYKMDEKLIRIPLLLRDERKRENDEPDSVPYERMKIDVLLEHGVGYSKSNYREPGTELQIIFEEENDAVIINLIGTDDDGTWEATGKYSIDEFMSGGYWWLDTSIGQVLYYSKNYLEE